MTRKKVELHVHLEGTISPSLAQKLANKNKIDLPSDLITEDAQGYRHQDFMSFLGAYDQVANLIKKPDDYYDLTLDYLANTAHGGGIYVEMMYSPDHAEQASGIPSREHLHAIQQAIDDAETKYGILGRILITAVRHFGAESAIKVAKQSHKDTFPCVVGFGLGGDEVNFPPRLFKEAYEIAADGGLKCTVHAGEFAPASGMMEAMDYLPIQRIGHGVRAIESQETIARLIDKQIALEICPTSNLVLGVFPSMAAHPFKKLLDAGVQISINSDDPPFFHTNLAKEYTITQAFYQFSDEQIDQITHMAIDHAFVDELTKQQLHAKV